MIRCTTRKGVPAFAVIASTAIGLLTTALNFFAPAQVFSFLPASSGAIALLVYLVIAVCQLRMRMRMRMRMRYKLERSKTPIMLKMWMFPVLTWLVIGFIVAALTTMVVLPEHRSEVTATGLLTVFTIALGLVLQKRRRPHDGIAASTVIGG